MDVAAQQLGANSPKLVGHFQPSTDRQARTFQQFRALVVDMGPFVPFGTSFA